VNKTNKKNKKTFEKGKEKYKVQVQMKNKLYPLVPSKKDSLQDL